MSDERREQLEVEIDAFMGRYNAAFVVVLAMTCKSWCICRWYMSLKMRHRLERYPFDPERMREATGFDHPKTETRIVHLEETRAHLTIEGTRHRQDGSVIESIDSFYILHKKDGEWGVSVFSGIRGAR